MSEPGPSPVIDTAPAEATGRGPGLRRYGSVSLFLLALLLFPLPWVEIQCASGKGNGPTQALANQKQVPSWLSRRLIGWGEERETIFWESGLQAALGTYS